MAVSRKRSQEGSEEERIVPGTPLWERQIEEHEQRYRFVAARLRPGMSVLDAGCGAGYGAALLADSGAAWVVAVDRSEPALAIARAHFDRPRVTWLCEDCQSLVEAGRHGLFALICNLENLEHLSDPDAFLDRASDLLEPGGTLITSPPNRIGVNRLRGLPPNSSSPNPYHVREYSSAELRALLLAHFAEISMHFQTLDPVERMDVEAARATAGRTPRARLGRLVRRIIGARPAHAPKRMRYQIVDADPGDERVITQLAVCRSPRRGLA